ncbi:hypothetical protein RchiOBHm_Chr3g0478291 [Rosa chinensis]|uniref:Uncharacterized protein n=1 Tax=Rosa chinensis TaxID=74649 RepID=A0A2P6RD60_ROSCH|nr:hypothetical protein RchiOBHm_Chr3g0478291 [Rosa chinensis]
MVELLQIITSKQSHSSPGFEVTESRKGLRRKREFLRYLEERLILLFQI